MHSIEGSFPKLKGNLWSDVGLLHEQTGELVMRDMEKVEARLKMTSLPQSSVATAPAMLPEWQKVKVRNGRRKICPLEVKIRFETT